MEATIKRSGTKPPSEITAMRCEVMRALLTRPEGATSAELITATGTSKQNVSLWLKKWNAVRREGRWYLEGSAACNAKLPQELCEACEGCCYDANDNKCAVCGGTGCKPAQQEGV